MKHLVAVLSVATLVLLSACSEDDAPQHEHFYNPLFSPDNSVLVAGYSTGSGTDSNEPLQPSTRLAILDMNTRRLRTVDLGTIITTHRVYSFDPSGSVLAFVQDEQVVLVDLNGTQRGVLARGGDIKPQVATFAQSSGTVLIWAGSDGSQLEIHRTVLDPLDWKVVSDSVLVRETRNGTPLSIASLTVSTLALRLGTGEILVYNYDGTLQQSFTTVPFDSNNPWHYRMHYFQRNPDPPVLYALEKEAVARLELATGAHTTPIKGGVVDVDVNAAKNVMFYETATGDTWMAVPTSVWSTNRLAPQSIMPRLSRDGSRLALVERYARTTDSLRILRLQ